MNENLVVEIQDNDTSNITTVAKVPEIITIIDSETMIPISCGQLQLGQKVSVLKLQVPKQLRTEKALKIVGPQCFF